MTKLEILLKKIDPEKTIQPIFQDMDRSINTLKLEKAAVNTREEFETCLANFIYHSDKYSLGRKMQVNKEFDYHRCKQFLIDEYGPNGVNIAFEIAQTGVDGGLYAVLKAIAARLANYFARNVIRYEVHEYCKNMTVDERMAAAKEYREKYGHIIPAKFTENGIGYLTALLPQILEEHPAMLQRMKRVGR
jgi:hypothetical protein